MTAVDVRFDVPGPGGRVASNGALVWTPTLRRVADDGAVVLPASFRVQLVGGVAAVEVDPTGPEWAWKVEELIPGVPYRVSYVTVPDLPAAVLFSDLVAVDPATLDPAAEPEAAWWAALEGKADKSGATFTGDVEVAGADLTVRGTGKAYRFRRGGGALDFEGAGADYFFSMWPAADFSGVQRSYDRYSADVLSSQHAGRREFVDALFGATRHVVDGTANLTGWYGAAPVGRQVVTGSRGGNAALGSLLTALANLGWIDDQTTA